MGAGKHPSVVDVPLMFKLWHDTTIRIEDVALRLRVSTGTLRKIAGRHGLHHRAPPPASGEFLDAPSPAEDLLSQDSLALSPWVEARAREIRERHFAERRGETELATRSKTWRDGVA
jgi:hypothetical protein